MGNMTTNQRRFLGRYNPLTLLARMDGRDVGFWIGFELKPGMYYHWLGGVLPEVLELFDAPDASLVAGSRG